MSYVGQQRRALSCSTGKFSRLFTEISSSSDNATDTSISVSLTVCCSPQLPAAIAHHVVWKPLRLTAAIYSCEVLGCLWGLHWPAFPCHSLLDRSLQQGKNSWRFLWSFPSRAWNDVTCFFVMLLGSDSCLPLRLPQRIASLRCCFICTNAVIRYGLRFMFTGKKGREVEEGETVSDKKIIGTGNGLEITTQEWGEERKWEITKENYLCCPFS